MVLGTCAAVHAYRARLDQPLGSRARGSRPARGEERIEAKAGVARARRQALGVRLGAPFHHVEQREHPHHDAGVGDVEGGPRHGIDEVDHGALPGAVGEVAECPAEQHPHRQPQPWHLPVD